MKNLHVYLITIFKNIIYGSTFLFTTKLLASTEVLDVLSIRFMISGAFLALLIVTKRIKVSFKGKKLGFIFLTALFEPVLEFAFETLGVANLSNITAGLISASAPIMNVLIQFIILKEKTNIKQLLCLCLGVLGLCYIVVKTTAEGGEDTPIGVVFMVVAVLFGVLYCSFSRKTANSEEFSAMEITCVSAFVGAVVFNGVNVVRHAVNGSLSTYFMPLLSFDNIVGFIVLGILSSILGNALSNYALAKLPPVRISVFSGFCTLTTVVLGVVCNNEKFLIFHLVGFLLVFISVIGANYFSEENLRKKRASIE